MIALLVLAGAATAMAPIDFDLAKVTPARDCPVATGEAIVVCGRKREERIKRLPDRTEPLLPPAEIALFGKVRASLHGEGGSAGGFPSNRVMATIKIPF